MLVHAGGFSQRLPHLSAVGKIFLTLPCGEHKLHQCVKQSLNHQNMLIIHIIQTARFYELFFSILLNNQFYVQTHTIDRDCTLKVECDCTKYICILHIKIANICAEFVQYNIHVYMYVHTCILHMYGTRY